MLLQSHTNEIHLLPALPSAWAAGKVRGLRARGGVEVDMEWKNGSLVQAKLMSRQTKTVRVRHGGRISEYQLRAGEPTVVRA